MNSQRRKDLQKAVALIDNAKEIIDNARSEEESYRDFMPENLQSSERFERADTAVSELEDAVSFLEDALTSIERATE